MKLLLTGAYRYSEEQLQHLKNMGHDLYFMQDERVSIDGEAIPWPISEIEGVICNGLFVYNKIEDFKGLKYVQLTSAGYDRAPVDYIKNNNIALYNAKGVYSIPMAEWALWKTLEFYKHAKFFADSQSKHLWQKDRGLTEIAGKRVLIVGSGSIGSEAAKRYQAFGANVYGIARSRRNADYYEEIYPLSELKAEVELADIVLLTIPLTKETEHLFDESMLLSLKENAVLINLSRGKIIDEKALADVLLRRTDIRAALDVFEEEPLREDSPLWDMPNVDITPHNSFVSDKNNERMFKVITDNLKSIEK